MVHYASAGNSASDGLSWPASLPAVNAVTAIEPSGQLASFSNFNDEISVSAPGVSIYTTDRTGPDGYASGDYVFFGGTSAASPYAAGVAALVLSVDPTLTAEEVETLVECSARDTGVFGFDKFFGHGFVNAANAVEAAAGTDTDLDGLVDPCDNCPDDSNANQADADADGLGDVCDDCTDVDGDGFGDPSFPATTCPPDNCVSVSNALQEDSDVDGIGDACDICPQDSDPGQMDTDLDGIGDACDDCPTVPNAGFSEFVVNGGFETSDRSGWIVQTTGSGDWTINDGTFDPQGPTGTFPPISGSFDIVVNQGGGSGIRSLLQTVMLPVDITAATLSWSDRTFNQAGSYNAPNQEFRVLLEEPGGALITGVYSTRPGDSLIQPGPNPRSFDLAVTLQAREGQQVVLNFEEQDDLNFFNVFIDDVSLSIERGAAGDADGDGAGDVCDNCEQANPLQADDDTDGVGNVCDICPADADPAQADADGDGAGDACDCRSEDPNDRAPGDVTTVTAARFGASTIELSWTAVTGADVYSVSRGILSALAAGSYGACLLEGHAPTSFQDADVPAIGDGYFYLVQGQSYECGLGSAGFTSDEDLRQNLDAGACVGQSHTDAYPTAETSVLGTATGSFGDVTGSDDVVQAITEEETGGSPANRTSLLEHHYNITVAPGSIVDLHIEGFRTSSVDGDDFAFEYSIDGGTIWNSIAMASLPLADDDIDLTGPLPSSLSGTVLFRVVDTDRTAGNIALDTVSIDELFVRSVP